MKDFKTYLIEKGQSEQTAKGIKVTVNRFIKWAAQENIPETRIHHNDLIAYLHFLQQQGVKQRTLQLYINALRHYFNFLRDVQEMITENPAANIKVKGVKRRTLYHVLSKEELEEIYQNVKPLDEESKHRNQNWFRSAQLVSKRNKIIVGLMIYQGLGSAELAHLKEEDIKLREGKIYIAGTRRSNERTLKLEAHQILDMMEYCLKTRNEILQITGKQSEKLLVSSGTSNHFRGIIQKLMKKLKQQNSHIQNMQQIRTSVITSWLKKYNLRQVQYMAGHRYVSSTEAYLINDLDDLKEDIGKYHPL